MEAHEQFQSDGNGQRGVVLLLVVFIITILVAMTVTLSDTAQNDLQVLQNYRASLQAYWTAQSAIQIIAAALSMTASMGPQKAHTPLDSPWHNESQYFQQIILPALSLPIGESNSIIGIPRDPLEPDNPPRPVVDENRKLSIAGTATQNNRSGLILNYGQPTEQTNPTQFRRLVYLLAKLIPRDPFAFASEGPARQEFIDLARAQQLAGYLVDWLDSLYNQANEFNLDQAEDTCPDDGLPYTTKNAAMDSIGELALVCGFRTLPHEIILRLAEHLTIYPITTNFHTATREVLNAFLEAANSPQPELYDRLHDPESPYSFGCRETFPNQPPDFCNPTMGGFGETSSIFQIDVYGVTVDPESGSELARRRIREVIGTGAGAPGGSTGLTPLYYRED